MFRLQQLHPAVKAAPHSSAKIALPNLLKSGENDKNFRECEKAHTLNRVSLASWLWNLDVVLYRECPFASAAPRGTGGEVLG